MLLVTKINNIVLKASSLANRLVIQRIVLIIVNSNPIHIKILKSSVSFLKIVLLLSGYNDEPDDVDP